MAVKDKKNDPINTSNSAYAAPQQSANTSSLASRFSNVNYDKVPSNINISDPYGTAKMGSQYLSQLKAAQYDPQNTLNEWDKYKTAQTGEAQKYVNKMEQGLAENRSSVADIMSKYNAAQDQYNARIGESMSQISQSQQGARAAADAAKAQTDAEMASSRDFFNTKTLPSFEAAMAKAQKEYDETRNIVRQKMDATDAYYQNSIKPNYAKLMEGGLSLRDVSDPSNYVFQNSQKAYENLITKSQADADKLSGQIRKTGQADYGVLAALANQARGNTGTAMTGAQQQLQEQASLNQAAQAYQNAQKRIASIEDQQRLYAQATRGAGVEKGFDLSQQNYQNYMTATGEAQKADIANYNAMLAGTGQLASMTGANANTQLQGTEGISSARQGLANTISNLIGTQSSAGINAANTVGNLAAQYGNLAGSQFDVASQATNLQRSLAEDALQKSMIVPTFNYDLNSQYAQGDYMNRLSVADQLSRNATTMANATYQTKMQDAMMNRSDVMRQEDIALQKEQMAAQRQAAIDQAKAQRESSFWSTMMGLGGTVLGGIGGSFIAPGVGTAMGATILGGLGREFGGAMAGSGTAGQGALQYGIGNALNYYNGYQNSYPYSGVGVSPYMNYAQNNYSLGINPSLMSAR